MNEEKILNIAGLLAEISTNLKLAGNALSRLSGQVAELGGIVEAETMEQETDGDDEIH